MKKYAFMILIIFLILSSSSVVYAREASCNYIYNYLPNEDLIIDDDTFVPNPDGEVSDGTAVIRPVMINLASMMNYIMKLFRRRIYLGGYHVTLWEVLLFSLLCSVLGYAIGTLINRRRN